MDCVNHVQGVMLFFLLLLVFHFFSLSSAKSFSKSIVLLRESIIKLKAIETFPNSSFFLWIIFEIMKIKVQKYAGPRNTMKEMKNSSTYFEDLGHLNKLSFEAFFDFVKNIPYIEDPRVFKNSELVARPKYLLNAEKLDCKKKAVLISAWCNGQKPKIKNKFVATSDRKDKSLHHVFNFIFINNGWLIADATFSGYFIGQNKPKVTHHEVL